MNDFAKGDFVVFRRTVPRRASPVRVAYRNSCVIIIDQRDETHYKVFDIEQSKIKCVHVEWLRHYNEELSKTLTWGGSKNE